MAASEYALLSRSRRGATSRRWPPRLRTEASRSPLGASFMRYASAPAATAGPTCLAWTARNKTFDPGEMDLTSLVASTPLIPGIWASMRTTSGRFFSAVDTAAGPSPTSATTSTSAWAWRMLLRLARMKGLSSTMSTRIVPITTTSPTHPGLASHQRGQCSTAPNRREQWTGRPCLLSSRPRIARPGSPSSRRRFLSRLQTGSE